MTAYIRRRLVTSIPVVLGVSLIVFLMLHFLPGDPVLLMLTEHRGGAAPTVSGNITQEMYDNMRHQLGLDRPLPIQFLSFLGGVVRGDLGTSFRGGEPVLELIRRNLPYTIQLALVSLGVAMTVGFVLGVIAAVRHGTWLDGLTMTIAAAGVSMPSFWLGIMLLLLFAVHLNLLPAVGNSADLQSMILPAIALGFGASAFIARLVRSSLLETLQQDYVRTARAKGLREQIVVAHHALKNALIPVVTVVGLQFGQLLGGTVVIETVFGRPGIGQIVVKGILERDFPVVQGVVLVSALTYVVANLLVDLLYTRIDPRIRVGAGT
jgi:ABC-type dipeptide/oligopeptide/nickel transport system permease component